MEMRRHTMLLSLFLVLAHIGHYFVITLSFHNEMTTVQYGTSALFVSYSPGEEKTIIIFG